jgi:hypothetical protein
VLREPAITRPWQVPAPLEAMLAGALLVGAFLLFVIEPMFAKMVLPLLGGTPAVWNTCVLFFQSMLLLGYLYAHIGPRLLGVRRHAVFHLAAVLLSLAALPITLHEMSPPPTSGSPVGWLIQVLMLSLGIPFLLLSSTGPLVQQWHVAIRHSSNPDPYFLYSASNAGSLLGLLAYPTIIEASLPLRGQARTWAGGYALYIVLIAACVSALWSSLAGTPAGVSVAETINDSRRAAVSWRPIWRERLTWMVLALVPSSLLLGLTTYVTMDLAAIPLLWIVPLAIYLMTCVIAFSRTPVLRHGPMVRLQPLLVVLLVVLMFWGAYLSTVAFIPLHLAAFFVTAMVCHGELAARRPEAARLTEYYVWLALGGVFGAAFNVLIAPNVFTSVLEYPLLLAVACLLRPRTRASSSPPLSIAGIVLAPVSLLAARHLLSWYDAPGVRVPVPALAVVAVASCVAALACYRSRNQPFMLAAGLGAIVASWVLVDVSRHDSIFEKRDFYGIHRVRRNVDDSTHVLLSGTTKHGAQSMTSAHRREPLSYYTRTGPLGDVFREIHAPRRRTVAVVGLGTGAMTAYGVSGERWTVYEIDPTVERIARDPRYFTYLADTHARVDVILGDGRLSLGRAKDGVFDLIVLDAFSSDAIPVHLFTREALALYFHKLAPGGALVFHLSNRYVDLEPVLARLAEDAGAVARIRDNVLQVQKHLGEDPSVWAVLGLDSQSLGGLVHDRRWRSMKQLPGIDTWTDDYSNVLRALKATSSF